MAEWKENLVVFLYDRKLIERLTGTVYDWTMERLPVPNWYPRVSDWTMERYLNYGIIN